MPRRFVGMCEKCGESHCATLRNHSHTLVMNPTLSLSFLSRLTPGASCEGLFPPSGPGPGGSEIRGVRPPSALTTSSVVLGRLGGVWVGGCVGWWLKACFNGAISLADWDGFWHCVPAAVNCVQVWVREWAEAVGVPFVYHSEPPGGRGGGGGGVAAAVVSGLLSGTT